MFISIEFESIHFDNAQSTTCGICISTGCAMHAFKIHLIEFVGNLIHVDGSQAISITYEYTSMIRG